MQPVQKAPAFSLYDTEKNIRSLSDYKGKPVVLIFFPQAFSSICTAELCSIRDDMDSYNALDAQVIGISVDSLFTLAHFKKEQQYAFPLLSDFNKEVSKAYDCFYEDFVFNMKGVAKRGAFVMDAEGNIMHREVMESAGDIPNFDTIKSVIRSLVAIKN